MKDTETERQEIRDREIEIDRERVRGERDINRKACMERETSSFNYTDRQRQIQTGKQTNRQTDRQINRQTVSHRIYR